MKLTISLSAGHVRPALKVATLVDSQGRFIVQFKGKQVGYLKRTNGRFQAFYSTPIRVAVKGLGEFDSSSQALDALAAEHEDNGA